MKIDRLETHDRLEHFKKDQALNIFSGAEECLRKNKDCVSMQQYFPYVYLFAHPRTSDDGVTKRMIWQPRLTKPKAQTNSYLFRAISKTDLVEIIWLIPPRELWEQYEKGKVTESQDIEISIRNFQFYREELERPHRDDLSEEAIKRKLLSIQHKYKGRLIR